MLFRIQMEGKKNRKPLNLKENKLMREVEKKIPFKLNVST